MAYTGLENISEEIKSAFGMKFKCAHLFQSYESIVLTLWVYVEVRGSKRKAKSFKDDEYYISSIPTNQVGFSSFINYDGAKYADNNSRNSFWATALPFCFVMSQIRDCKNVVKQPIIGAFPDSWTFHA